MGDAVDPPSPDPTGWAAAPGKINLFLEVHARRSDGWHEVTTVLVPLRVADEVRAVRVPEPGLDVRVSAAPDAVDAHLPAWLADVPSDPTNLAARAAAALLEATGAVGGVRIAVAKRLPPGAGLGGGSSDAAIVLERLNAQVERPLDAAALADLAAGLGSDVPFFLRGDRPRPAAAVATGRGEDLRTVPAAEGPRMLVLWPGVPCPTPVVYEECTPAEAGDVRDPADVLAALATGDVDGLRAACFNRLAPAAEAVEPRVAAARSRLAALGQGPAFVTGSGSAVFVILSRDADEEALRARLDAVEGEVVLFG